MGIEWITVLMFGSMLVLLALGLPLAFVTGLIGVTFCLGLYGPNGLQLIASRIYSFMNEYALVSVPMFIMMASLMERSGVAKDLFDAMRIWAGKLPGGLAIQTMVAATIMGAMTGIIGGEIVLLGLSALPQMLRLGYERKLAIGTICAGGSLGTMIPPSIVLIIYGLTVNVPIGDLFTANLVPGLILSGVYMVYIFVRCQVDPNLGPPAPESERNLPLSRKLAQLKSLLLPMVVISAVLGTIYAGVASVTEAAGMGVVGTMVASAVRRELTWSNLRESMLQTMRTCGMLLWLSFGATAMIGSTISPEAGLHARAVHQARRAAIGIILLMMLILLVLGASWTGWGSVS
jgi:tripartite ATP-independent transporter DctM subunit